MIYKPVGCRWCGASFHRKTPSTNHCSFRCRFTEIAWRSRSPLGCWEWPGATNKDGYGQVSGPNGKTLGAHQASAELFKGSVPSGSLVLHACDNRRCINPDHLFFGSPKMNSQDMVLKGRHANQKKAECKRGHALAGENLYVEPAGGRRCRTCKNLERTSATTQRRALWHSTGKAPSERSLHG